MKQSFKHYFPTPSYLSMDSYALDISDESIKYGKLLSKPSGFNFTKFGKEKIPEGIIVSGIIKKKEKLINLLKNLRIKENLNFVRISLPEEQIYIFTLSLPQMHGEDLKEMILLQIEEHIPLNATEVIFDYNTLYEDKKKTTVVVTAIPIDVIESYLFVFKEAQLIPLSFESEAQAITRAVFPRYEKSSVMVVDFGYDRTGVSVSYQGNVLFTTTLDIGGFNLTEMLSKNFSISIKEAEEIKRSYGLNTSAKSKEIFPVLLNGVSVLRDELNKQFLYWERHNKENSIIHEKINRIIICGGNANLPGLAEYLEATIKIKVEHANTWINIFDMKKVVPILSFEESLSYATVIGLGLNGVFGETESVINVLPKKEKKILRKKYWVRLISIFLGLFFMTEILLFFLLVPAYLFSITKQQITENRLESFNINNPEINTKKIDNTIKNINKRSKILAKKELNQEIGADIFNWLLVNKPPKVSYSQILYNIKTDKTKIIELHGIAKNRSVLTSFKSKLDENTNFSEVNLPISDFLEKKDLNFTISIILK